MKMSHVSRLLLILALSILPFASAHATSAQEHLDAAERYLDAGELEKAVIEAKNALQKDPESGEVRFFLGEAYLRLGQGAAAEKEYRFARAAGFPPDRVLAPLGEAYLLQGNHRAVLDEVRPLAGDDPDFQAKLLVLRARAYLQARRRDEAADALEKAGSLVSDDVGLEIGRALLAVADRDSEQVERHVNRALEIEPDNARALAMQGELLRQDGKMEKALQAYTDALQLDPFNRESLLGTATVNVALRRLDAAEQALERLDTFSPGMLHRQYLAAVIAFYRKDFDAVQELLTPIRKAAPGYLQSELLAGVASYQKGQMEAANAHLSDFIKAQPGHLPARKLLALLKLRQDEPQQAVDILRVVGEQGSGDAQYLAMLGSAYLKAGDASNAMQYLEQAAEIAPDAASIQSQLGLGHLALGDTEQAVSRLESAVSMDPQLVQADLVLVQIHLRKREYDKAIAVARKMLDADPANPLPYNLMAAAYLGKQESAQAREALRKSLEIDPSFRPAYINLARLDIRDGDLEAARGHYQAILELDTGHTQAYLGLAELENRQGNREQAVEWLSRAVAGDPGALRPGVMLVMHHLSRGESLKALPIARTLVNEHPDNPVALETLANVQLRNNDLANAIGSYEKLARLRPELAAIQVRLGELHLRDESYDAARRAFEKALQLEEDNLSALTGLGALELITGNPEAARELADRLVSDYAESPLGWQLLGDIQRGEKDYAAAADAYTKAYQLEASAQRALLAYRMRKASGEGADPLAILREWLGGHPEDANVQLVLASEYLSSGQVPLAIEGFEQVRQLKPDNVTALNNLAWLYHERGDGRAREFARQARDLAPKQPEVLDTYGWIELHAGDPAKGLEAIREASVFGPHIPTIHYHLAVAQEKNGRMDAARKTLGRLLKSGKRFPERDKAEAMLKRLGPGD